MAGLDSSEARAAMSRYFEDCFRTIGSGGERLPAPDMQLSDHVADISALHVGFEYTAEGAEPQRVLCPDGTSGECWKEQRKIGGRTVWVWVCNCH